MGIVPTLQQDKLITLVRDGIKVDCVCYITHNNDVVNSILNIRGVGIPISTPCNNLRVVCVFHKQIESIICIDKNRAGHKVLVELTSGLVELANVGILYGNIYFYTIMLGCRLRVNLANLSDVGFVKVRRVHRLGSFKERDDIKGVAIGKGRLGTKTKRTVEVVG